MNIKTKNMFCGYAFIAPLMIGLGIFYLYPFLENFYNSFTDYSTFGKTSFIGLANYKRLLNDEFFWKSIINTFKYLLHVPVAVILSLIMALLLNNKIKGATFYRTVLFLPMITIPTATAMIWQWIFDKDFGLINGILIENGIIPVNWLGDPKIAFWVIIVILVWNSLGYNMIILLAGLQNIPTELYEAAEVDGVGKLGKLFKITLPLLSPTLFFVSITSFITGFQIFDIIFMLFPSNSGIEKEMSSIIVSFYKYAFVFNERGYASAITIVLFLIIIIFTIFQLKLQKKLTDY